MAEPASVATSRRYLSLDLLRGLGVLGILAVNAMAFAQPLDAYSNPAASPVPLTAADVGVWWLTETFFRDKFVTAFSLLFGVSLYLVGERTQANVPTYRTPLFRRLIWLVVFGLLHGALIWQGDILLLYAISGLIFWRWREATARRLLTIGSVLFLLGAACQVVPSILQQISHPDTLYAPPDLADSVAAMRGGFAASLAENARIWSRLIPLEIVVYLPSTVGLMMLGLGLFKAGFLKGEARPRVYGVAMVVAVVCLGVIGAQSALTAAQGFPYPQIFGLYDIANTLLCLPVSLGYAAALILLARSAGGRFFLHPLACTGRMAFSNYLAQSLIMTAIFYGGRGPGLFGTMNHAALVPIVLAVWAGQLVVSPLWLSVFRYGPFEWLWRSLTFRRLVALVKPGPTSASGR